jgi:DNA-binding response OmpR family regulator
VLLIDDEEEFVRTTAMLLRRRGFEVITAGSGRDGLSVLGRQPVDVVVLDIKMPGMDGDEVLEVMNAKGFRQPVVILTGHGSVDHALDMGRAGVTGYLAKPCTVDELERKLRKALESVARDNHRRHRHGDTISVLLVDDEAEFRQSTSRTLSRRGFEVTEAASGEEALVAITRSRPQIVVLDLKMPGMDGLATLHRIRERDAALPVVMLTGHGNFRAAFEGIRMEIVDFLAKPVDIDHLAARLRELVADGRPLHERSVAQLMVPAGAFPHLTLPQSARAVFEQLSELLLGQEEPSSDDIRTVVVENSEGTFLGLASFADLLSLIVPPYLSDSVYSTFFTGMLLAQCKVLGQRAVTEIVRSNVKITAGTPLMYAIHLMAHHRLDALPVLEGTRLVGVLLDRTVILEIIRNLGHRAPTGDDSCCATSSSR